MNNLGQLYAVTGMQQLADLELEINGLVEQAPLTDLLDYFISSMVEINL